LVTFSGLYKKSLFHFEAGFFISYKRRSATTFHKELYGQSAGELLKASEKNVYRY